MYFYICAVESIMYAFCGGYKNLLKWVLWVLKLNYFLPNKLSLKKGKKLRISEALEICKCKTTIYWEIRLIGVATG